MSHSKLLSYSSDTIREMQLDQLKPIGLDRTLDSYYLVGPYPPLLQMEEPVQDKLSILTRVSEVNINSVDLYLHFPFCRVAGQRECSFCHFYKENHDEVLENDIIDAWIKELNLYKSLLEKPNIKTIYFGGGSVSLIQPRNLKKIVDFLQIEMGVVSSAEVKFEIHADAARNPKHINEILDIISTFENLKLVIDIQSLNPQTLNYVSWGRVTVEDYFDTLNLVRSRGFKSICTGLILGLPYETPETFLDGLSKLVTIPELEMLNIFPLMFKECDHVINILHNAPELLFDMETRELVSVAARRLLKAFGFKESPIYFYSRGDSEPVHQLNKFQGENTLIAIGPSAFGYISCNTASSIAYYNLPSITKYLESLNSGKLPIWRQVDLNNDNKAVRQILLAGINMLKPFSTNDLSQKLKQPIEDALNIFKEYGLLFIDKDGLWHVTEKGCLRAEEMSYYLASIDIGMDLHNTLSKEQKTSLHFFPNRTEEQRSYWNNKMNKKIV